MMEELSNIFVPVASTVLTAILLYIVKLLVDIKKGTDQHNKILYGDSEMKELSVGLIELTIENRKALIQMRTALLTVINNLMKKGLLDESDEMVDIVCILKACLLDETSIRK